MPIQIALDSFLTAATKNETLVTGPLSTGCFIALKYADGYFSVGHVGSKLYLSISQEIGTAIKTHGTVLCCHFYYTNQDVLSTTIHNAIKMHISDMFKVFPNWGAPKIRSEKSFSDSKLIVTQFDAYLKLPRKRIQEILKGENHETLSSLPAKKLRLGQ